MRWSGRWLGLGALLIGISCGGGKATPKDGGAGMGGGSGGAWGAADGGLVGCLATPGGLDRPPSGPLPCELIPPGLRL